MYALVMFDGLFRVYGKATVCFWESRLPSFGMQRINSCSHASGAMARFPLGGMWKPTS
jgi:hypothetical protein